MKFLVYITSGILTGLGLAISGMIDPEKITNFLNIISPSWNPALIFVLGSAVPVYFLSFKLLQLRRKTLNGTLFEHPAPRPINKKLVFGSALFGIGWGIVGVCPGPAWVHVAFLEWNFAFFILSMIVGIELQRRFS